MPRRFSDLTVLSAFLIALITAGCARAPAPETRLSAAETIAAAAGLEARWIETGTLSLLSFRRGQAEEITLYIEGDGYAWRSPRRPSSDPTPINPVALRLAALDGADAVAYLGRACQYGSDDPACADNDLWTSHRFSEASIAAADTAIDALKREAGAARIHLVGYSGGAAVAALVAARRDDVASLRTVAGYLDPTGLNAERGVSPLHGSLDPVTAAPLLAGMPQAHYAGGADGVIPAWSIARFVEVVGDPSCAQITVVEHASHQEGWVAFWRAENETFSRCALNAVANSSSAMDNAVAE